MTLLVGEEKGKFNLYQSIQLIDEENNFFMRIESSLLPFEELAPTLLLKDTLEGYKFEANSLSAKELAFELLSPIVEVEEFILTSDEDKDEVLSIMDEGLKRSSRNSPMSLAGL